MKLNIFQNHAPYLIVALYDIFVASKVCNDLSNFYDKTRLIA